MREHVSFWDLLALAATISYVLFATYRHEPEVAMWAAFTGIWIIRVIIMDLERDKK